MYTLAISPGYAKDRKVYIGTETGLCVSWPTRAAAGTSCHTRPRALRCRVLTLNQQESGGLLLRVESEAGEVFMSEDEGQSWELLSGR